MCEVIYNYGIVKYEVCQEERRSKVNVLNDPVSLVAWKSKLATLRREELLRHRRK